MNAPVMRAERLTGGEAQLGAKYKRERRIAVDIPSSVKFLLKKVRRKIRTDDVQTAEEASMAVTYYVALPFIRTDDGTAPGEAQECQSEAAAIRRAEGISRDPAYAGAVAFKRAGDPNVGEFSDAVVLKKFGEVPEDLSAP